MSAATTDQPRVIAIREPATPARLGHGCPWCRTHLLGIFGQGAETLAECAGCGHRAPIRPGGET